MEEKDRKLYPLRFLEEREGAPWGEVTYQIADLGFKDSMVADGWFGGNTLSELMGTYMERVSGDDAFEYYGLQFPLMVKILRTTGWQPLQVAVSDEVAQERYDSFGKTAFWHVLEAAPEAVLYLGLNRDVEPGDFYRRCLNGSVRDVLNEVRPQKGDSFLITPGTVFAAGPGLTIVEISECSELTLPIHNWGVPLPGGDPLLLEEAFDLIDFSKVNVASIFLRPPYASRPNRVNGRPQEYRCDNSTGEHGGQSDNVGQATEVLAECEVFEVKRMELKDPLRIFSEQPGALAIYFCISGEATIFAGDSKPRSISAGHSILVPSEVHDFVLAPSKEGTTVLEAMPKPRADRDSYVGDSPAEDAPDPHIRNWN